MAQLLSPLNPTVAKVLGKLPAKVGVLHLPISWRLGRSDAGRSDRWTLQLTVNLSVFALSHCSCTEESSHSDTERADTGSYRHRRLVEIQETHYKYRKEKLKEPLGEKVECL